MSTKPNPKSLGISSQIVAKFLQGPLPVMVIVLSLLAGAAALILTPREEEPQIVVPLADVMVSAPGLSAEQIERQVATPLEKLLYQIDGVEYVYSMSKEGGTVVTVRFFVGQDRVASLVKIYNKIQSSIDQVPAAVKGWVVKPIEIDDVPIVIATLWSDNPQRTGDPELRRLAEEVAIKLQGVKDTNKVEVVGGRPRAIRVELKPEALAARRTTPLSVAWALGVHNQQLPAGEVERANKVYEIEAGAFIRSARELESLVVNVVDGIPVYLKDVATVIDGPAEVDNYTWVGFGPASEKKSGWIVPPRRGALGGQEEGDQRRLGRSRRGEAIGEPGAHTLPSGGSLYHHAQQRRDRQRESQRTGRGADRGRADGDHLYRALPGLARGDRRGASRAGLLRRHAADQPAAGLLDQPRHALRTDPGPGPFGR